MNQDVRYERIVGAPPEEVFDAFTSAGGQIAFYGNDDPGWMVESQCDLRVGGLWTVTFGLSPDHLYHHRSVFEVIDRPQRLQLSTTETRLDGTTLQFQAELTFQAVDGGTLMTMIQRGLPTDELRREHASGVPSAFDRLEQHIRVRATGPS